MPEKKFEIWERLQRRKIGAEKFEKGEFVLFAGNPDKLPESLRNEKLFYIEKISTIWGYELKAVGKEDTATRIIDADLKRFYKKGDWTDVKDLNKRGFLILHTVNAFGWGGADSEASYRERVDNPLQNIITNIKQAKWKYGKRFAISCFSWHHRHPSWICIHPQRTDYAFGVVLSKGKVTGAWDRDVGTETKGHALHRTTHVPRMPVRAAVTQVPRGTHNEITVQLFEVGGLFYTASFMDPEVLERLKKIAIDHKLLLYEIVYEDPKVIENVVGWKAYAFKNGKWKLVKAVTISGKEHLLKGWKKQEAGHDTKGIMHAIEEYEHEADKALEDVINELTSDSESESDKLVEEVIDDI